MTRPTETLGQFTAGMRRAGVKTAVQKPPGSPFKRLPDDILIGTTGPDGQTRSKEEALALARNRDATAVYVGRAARWVVFRARRTR